MDEYHNDFPFEGLLQSAYDDNGYIKAEENSSNGIETIDIFSALALTSNYIPDNSIFFSPVRVCAHRGAAEDRRPGGSLCRSFGIWNRAV